MPAVHAARRDALRQTLVADGVDALLVSASVNVGYLSGFSGDSTAMILLTGRELVVSDFRYEEQLARECPDVEAAIRPVSQPLWDAVAGAVDKLGVKRLAFEANGILVSDHETLKTALPTVEIVGLTGRVETLRAIKDDGEVAAVRRAIEAAERAFAELRVGLKITDEEADAAFALERALKDQGSERPAFDPIVAAGAHAALPHARPRAGARVDDGGFLLVDWGATVDGYRSDLTRMIVTGTVGEEFRRVYEAVLAAQARAVAVIRPGVRAHDVDAEARTAIEEAGFGGLFGHGLGHGIGLEIHESPRFRPHSEDVLRAGMIVTVEPGIYRPGWGGIRIEDDVLVTPDGVEILTSAPKSLESLALP